MGIQGVGLAVWVVRVGRQGKGLHVQTGRRLIDSVQGSSTPDSAWIKAQASQS